MLRRGRSGEKNVDALKKCKMGWPVISSDIPPALFLRITAQALLHASLFSQLRVPVPYKISLCIHLHLIIFTINAEDLNGAPGIVAFRGALQMIKLLEGVAIEGVKLFPDMASPPWKMEEEGHLIRPAHQRIRLSASR
ncbi:hypothetical protein SUGI_1116150 [Cryptomeria japonica]|nr:hypothetical protein SUGI_1116150 [Cryptomeria japonica]